MLAENRDQRRRAGEVVGEGQRSRPISGRCKLRRGSRAKPWPPKNLWASCT